MNTQDFETMVSDYVIDPNCRPELWVSYETPIQSERDAFCNDERVKAAFAKQVKESIKN